MLKQKRHALILAELARRRMVTVDELSRLLPASAATIRRDLSELEQGGTIRRVHGGAELVAAPGQAEAARLPAAPPAPRAMQSLPPDPALLRRKRAIARAAADLCQPGEAVIINGGTTTFEMGPFIRDKGLQVFTNSFSFAAYLLGSTNNRVLVPGGEVYREQNIILSPFDNDTIQTFFASAMFLSAYAVGENGPMERDARLIRSETKLMNQAARLILLADSTKFQRTGGLILCPLDRIDTVVTDDGVEAATVRRLEARGLRVVVAEAGEALPLSA